MGQDALPPVSVHGKAESIKAESIKAVGGCPLEPIYLDGDLAEETCAELVEPEAEKDPMEANATEVEHEPDDTTDSGLHGSAVPAIAEQQPRPHWDAQWQRKLDDARSEMQRKCNGAKIPEVNWIHVSSKSLEQDGGPILMAILKSMIHNESKHV